MAITNVPDSGNPVTNMGNLQLAVNAAARGDTITLAPRVVYRGMLVLPPTAGTADIIITTNLPLGLSAAGHRINPDLHLAALPILEVLNNNEPAVKTCDPSAGVSSHFIIRGLEIRSNVFAGGALVAFGSADTSLTNKQDTAAKVPTDLTLDRCYVHGLPFIGQKRGVALDCLRATIIENHISECWGIGQDTQAIAGSNGLGTYVIRNNFLEGSGENVLMGGADPIIPNLVPTGLTFTRNDVSKPLSWFDPVTKTSAPILSTPTNVVVNIGGTGGTLPAATYGYRVMARCVSYTSNIARSTPAATVSVTITLGQLPQVSWAVVPGATSYYIYRTDPSSTERFSTTTLSFADSGTTGVVEAVPGGGTQRLVKNIFELKNFDGATVVGNRFTRHWVQAQPGPAIVLTGVNQDGTNNNTVVQNVLFAYNKIDSVAGVYSISSHDAQAAPYRISRRVNNITIRHNLHTNVGSAWGTGQLRELLQVNGSPANTFEGADRVTYEHNTTLSSGMNSAAYFADFSSTLGYPKTTNFIFRNNLTRRGSFGIFGGNSGEGNVTLTDYCTAPTVTRNAIVGITTSQYPAGNFGPTEVTFQAQFVDYAGGNFRLAASSIYKGQATDGTDLGADLDLIDAQYAGTVAPPQTVTFPGVGGSSTLTVATAIDCPWSAVSNDSWIVITNSAAHVGGGTVTYTVSSNPGGPRQGTMLIAGTIITIVQVTGGIATATTGVGALTLAGAAPSLKRTFVISPGVGALVLAGAAASDIVAGPTAVVVAPPKGTLTLTGLAPSLSGTATEAPGVGALTLAGLAPAAVARQALTFGVGALTFSGLAVTRITTLSNLPGVGALTLLGRAPVSNQTQFAAMGVGALTLTGLVPTRLELIPRLPGVGALVLAGLAPTLSQAHKPPLGVGALTLLGLAPTGNRTYLAQPDAGALILTGLSGGATTLSSRVPDAGALVLAGLVPTIPQAILAQPGVGALVIAGLAPVRTANAGLQTSQGTLILQGHLVGSFATYSTLQGVGALTLLGKAPAAGQSYFVGMDVGALTLTGAAPTLFGIGTVAPAAGTLTLAGLAPSAFVQMIFPGAVGALVINGLAPATVLTGGTDVPVAPSQGELLLMGLAPLSVVGILIDVPAGALVLASEAPPIFSCTATVDPTLITSIAAGGIVIITVDIGDLCTWTAVSNTSWLTLTPASGLGPGTVQVTIAANTDTAGPREGTLDIAGVRVVVVQIAAVCSYSVVPASIHASGAVTTGSITVTTTSGCTWTAFSPDAWITVLTPSGTGTGPVDYALALNPSTSTRHGTIIVAGQIVTVLQRGRNSVPGSGGCPQI